MTQSRYLPNATSFVGFVVREKPLLGNKLDHICPVCAGHGGWNLTLNAYGTGKHFNAACFQCNGWGWVNKDDAECVHDFAELGVEECKKRGLTHYGKCWHVYACKKCQRVRGVDTSD